MSLERTISELKDLHREHIESENHEVAYTLAEAIERLEDFSAILGNVEYTIGRPAFMPDMSGRERFITLSGNTFNNYEQAYSAWENVPFLRDREAVILKRIGPVNDWEEVVDE